MNKKLAKKMVFYLVFGIALTFGLALISVVDWSLEYFGVGLEQIIFTLTAPNKGANSGVVVSAAFKSCLPFICLPLMFYCIIAFLDCKFGLSLNLMGRIRIKANTYLKRILRIAVATICVLALIFSLFYANGAYGVVDYIKTRSMTTTIYEDYYVDPHSTNITADGDTKNLIYIYLESMETSYASAGLGGFQKKNLIPNLVELADTNISFSNTDGFGGFYSVTGSSWTMGALFALNSGVPFAFPIEWNSVKQYENFANGIVTLGDILKDKGYIQEFLCGSDVEFGGRRSFFEQHGDYKLFDYYSAIESKYIDEDYHVFWGLEDKKLYEIAKDEIKKLSVSGKPFNFSMLTVDTHFPSGYTCELCNNEYEKQAENVVACADRQLNEFINWCGTQDFYEDTVIVIVGDHPRMETVLVPEEFSKKPRTVYNCIINSGISQENINFKNRVFTAMDYFPTVLASMGFKIEGERLGLGTNLLSEKQTLAEEIGLSNFSNELSKKSDYYVKSFS